MPAKRLRFVRSSTSFDDMSVLKKLLPAPELRLQMKLPRYPTNILMEEDYVSQPAILTLPSPNMKKKNNQGHSGNFLDRCNYCRNTLGEKDNIYMYSSLRAFCRNCYGQRLGKRVLCGRETNKAWQRKMNNLTSPQ